MKIKIAILITCHNRKKKTLKCLKFLKNQKNVEHVDFKVYLTDDNSQDGTKEEVLKKYSNVEILNGNGNLFWGGGTNLCFKEAVKKGFDYYIWLNDDTYLFQNAISDLLKAKEILKIDTFIAVGSTKNKKNKLTYGGQKNYGLKTAPFKNKIIQPTNCFQLIDRFNGNIVLISKKAQKKIGFIDKNLIHVTGDIEYGLRASKLGIPILLCPKFQGMCEDDIKKNLLKDYFKGKKLIQSYFFFTKKYGGFFWILHFLSALLSSFKILKLK